MAVGGLCDATLWKHSTRPAIRMTALTIGCVFNNGLPIHIGAALPGHANLRNTRGYVAVFDEDEVRHYQMHIARRRALRPDHEYGLVPMRNGRNSKNTLTSARSNLAPAADPTALLAPMNTPASAVPCSTWSRG